MTRLRFTIPPGNWPIDSRPITEAGEVSTYDRHGTPTREYAVPGDVLAWYADGSITLFSAEEWPEVALGLRTATVQTPTTPRDAEGVSRMADQALRPQPKEAHAR